MDQLLDGFDCFTVASIFSTKNQQKLTNDYYRTPPPENTCHIPHGDTWHALPSGSTPIRIHVTRLSYPNRLKEVQTTLINIRHPDGFHKYIRMTNINHPNIIVRVID
uniref:Uncharacterized protein n=1 Tax=Vitis vinifera TaxID=29760 RepID=A5BBS4_VITVI|nr:hypothetical protein VITISV_022240 [Vitis vinifera]